MVQTACFLPFKPKIIPFRTLLLKKLHKYYIINIIVHILRRTLMKKIRVRFEKDSSLSYIDIAVRAAERDADAETLIGRILEISSKKINLLDGDGNLCVISADDIISATVSGKRIKVITEQGAHFSQKPLQTLSEELGEEHFVRISRFEIVNTDKIAKFDFTLSGTLRIVFKNGDETWASRRSIPQIRKKLFGKGRE